MKKSLILAILFTCLHCFGQLVRVTWDANPETDIAGYRLHYSTNSLTPPFAFTNNVNSVTLTSTIPVVSDRLYAIHVTAYNLASLESDYSDQLRYQLFRTFTHVTNNITLLGSTNWPAAILRRGTTNGILSGTPPNLQYKLTNTTSGIYRDHFIYEITDTGTPSTNYYSIQLIDPNMPPTIQPHIDIIDLNGVVADVSPVMWWPFDETLGTAAADVVGGLAATLIGGASWTTGRIAGGVQLSGTGQQVNVNEPLTITGNKLTVMAWVLHDNPQNSFPRILSVATNITSSGRWFELTKFVTQQIYSFSVHTDAGFAEPRGGTALIGQWQHVAGVYNGTNAMLYVDGQLIHTLALTGNLRTNAPPMVIGQVGNGNTRGWLGVLDDIRVYSSALTQQNIADIILSSTTP